MENPAAIARPQPRNAGAGFLRPNNDGLIIYSRTISPRRYSRGMNFSPSLSGLSRNSYYSPRLNVYELRNLEHFITTKRRLYEIRFSRGGAGDRGACGGAKSVRTAACAAVTGTERKQ